MLVKLIIKFLNLKGFRRLSARTAMNRQEVNEIHDALTDDLWQHGFDVERGQMKNQLLMDIND